MPNGEYTFHMHCGTYLNKEQPKCNVRILLVNVKKSKLPHHRHARIPRIPSIFPKIPAAISYTTQSVSSHTPQPNKIHARYQTHSKSAAHNTISQTGTLIAKTSQ